MSRLLTLKLLYKSGNLVGKYISIEMIIEESKRTYYETLQASSAGWLELVIIYSPNNFLGFRSRINYLIIFYDKRSKYGYILSVTHADMVATIVVSLVELYKYM